jgi:hypothetical protein
MSKLRSGVRRVDETESMPRCDAGARAQAITRLAARMMSETERRRIQFYRHCEGHGSVLQWLEIWNPVHPQEC